MLRAQQNHTVWTAHYDPLAGAIAVGRVLVLNEAGTRYLPSTAANRAEVNRRSAGIALSAADGETTLDGEFQFVGIVPPEVSRLGTGTASALRVSSDGWLERVESPTADDEVVGRCDADGTAYVVFAGIQGATGADGEDATPITLGGSNGDVMVRASATATSGVAPGDEDEVLTVVDGEWASAPPQLTPPAGDPGQFQINLDDESFGAVRMTYDDGTGEIAAESDLHQTVRNEGDTASMCVWSAGFFNDPTVFGDVDFVAYGSDAEFAQGSQPTAAYVNARRFVQFYAAFGDSDYATFLLAAPVGTSTGTAGAMFPNFLLSGVEFPSISAADDLGTGKGVLAIKGATTNPSTNPSGGIVVYSDAGDSHYLKYRLPGGTTAVPVNTLTNAGSGSALVKTKSGIDYPIRSLVAGTGVTLTENTDDVTIACSVSSGAPTDASYVTLGTNATLSNERVLTAGTGISISDGGAGSTVTISSTVSATSPGGSSTYVQFNDAGSFAGQNDFVFSKAQSLLAVPYIQGTWFRSSSSQYLVDSNGTSGYIFTEDDFSDQCADGYIHASTSVNIGTSVTSHVTVDASNIKMGLPVQGNGSGKPFRLKLATVTITGAEGVAITATQAEYECPILILVDGGAVGTTAELVLPNAIGAVYLINNLSSRQITVTDQAGTGTATIDGGDKKIFWHDGTNYVTAVNNF